VKCYIYAYFVDSIVNRPVIASQVQTQDKITYSTQLEHTENFVTSPTTSNGELNQSTGSTVRRKTMLINRLKSIQTPKDTIYKHMLNCDP